MINRIKRDLISLWKLYKLETIIFMASILLCYVLMLLRIVISVFVFILGMLSFLSCIPFRRTHIDKYKRFLYTKPFFSRRTILYQNSKKCKYDCQEVTASLLSKKKVEETISRLPKGNYKSITHSSVINAIRTFDNEISVSNVLYNDKLSNIRKRLLSKKCPCSNDIVCKYRKHLITSQNNNDKVSFHYIEFTIK